MWLYFTSRLIYQVKCLEAEGSGDDKSYNIFEFCVHFDDGDVGGASQKTTTFEKRDLVVTQMMTVYIMSYYSMLYNYILLHNYILLDRS